MKNNVKEELLFNSLDEFCDHVVDRMDDIAISIAAKYDVMKEIFNKFYVDHNIPIYYIENFGEYDITGYGDEYLLEIWDHAIYIEPYKVDENCVDPDREYLITDCDVLYVHGDCNSKILKQDLKIIPFDIKEKCEEKKECCRNDDHVECCKNKEEHVKCCKDKDGNVYRVSPETSDLITLFLIRDILFR